MSIIKSYNFIIPFLILFLTFIFTKLNINLLDFKEIILAILIFSLLISLFFDKSKLFLLQLIPIFFYFYAFYPAILHLQGGHYSFWYIYPISLSLCYMSISILDERGLYNIYGLLKIIVLFIILSFSYYLLYNFDASVRTSLSKKILSFDLSNIFKCNDLSLILISISIIFTTLFWLAFYKKRVDNLLVWTLIAQSVPVLFYQNFNSFLIFSGFSSILTIYTILKEAYNLAFIDTLTQIPSRRALEEEFLKLGKKYAIAMIDIDFFKKFNDTYGHDTGDEVLKLVAKEIQNVKGGGKSYRYGGEEFTILFHNKDSKSAVIYLEEIRKNIFKREFIIRDINRPKEKPKQKIQKNNKKRIKISVSIGVASAPKDATNPYTVLKIADKMLYQAKERGRNCVVST